MRHSSRHEHVVELHPALAPHEYPHIPYLDARAVRVHHEHAQIHTPGPVVSGVRQRNQVVGIEPTCDERLLAVYHPAAVLRHGVSVHRGEIRTRTRLVEALPGDGLAFQAGRDEALFLILGSPDHHRRNPSVVVAHAGQRHTSHLLHKHDIEAGGQPAAAKFPGPGRRKPALFAKHPTERLDFSLVLRVQRAAVGRDLQVSGKVLYKPGAHRHAEFGLLSCVRRSEVQAIPPSPFLSGATN